MANMPDVNKAIRSLQIPLDLMARIKKYAEACDMTVCQFINVVLHERFDYVVLDDDDNEWIKNEVKKNKAKRKMR